MEAEDRLRPYVAGLTVDWLQREPGVRHRRVEGSLAFVDVSGFTRLTERLAGRGKAGAEELSTLLDATFGALLARAYSYGTLLVKWGGDAVLLLFEGEEHELLACRAAHEMRAVMRDVGRLQTSVGRVTLRMSVGVHSGAFDFFLVGERHHELVVAGPAATVTAELEGVAEAGEIVVSGETAAALAPECVGAAKGDGFLLRSAPAVDPRCRFWPRLSEDFDFGSCLDPMLRDHLLASDGEPEHRQIAIAFVEVSAIDATLAQHGPETVAAELHTLMTLVQDMCGRHHVTFWETDIAADGFKILLIAGAPSTTGHDEEGMLRAAHAILAGWSGRLSLRIGANCGRAFVGDFGPHFRRTFSVKADAVNLAARVMGKSQPLTLLATTTIVERAATRFETEALAPFMVKGKQHPVHAVRVGAAIDRGASAETVPAFVGRAEESAALAAQLARAASGRGGAVHVSGPPGVGKSRLVDEVLEHVEATVLRTAGDDYESATAYFPLRALLRAALGTTADADDDAVVAALTSLAERSAPELLPWLPLLASPLDVDLPDTEVTAAVATDFRSARVAAIVVALLAAALPGPAVLVVDDAHSIDDATVEVLDRIAAAAADFPWLLLTVSRDAQRPALTGATATPLAALDADATAQLVRTVAGDNLLTTRTVTAIVERSGGNPLFAVRLLSAAGSGDDDGELPGTVEELLAAQIDELPPPQRTLLRVAAVLGVRVDTEVLARLVDRPATPTDWAALERFVHPDGRGGQRFGSTLLRDAAYEGLSFRRRRELHGRAADEIARRASGRLEEHAESLSRHFFVAQRYADAWQHSLLAGERARRLGANAEALTFLRRARAAARRLPGLPPDDVARVLETIGDLHARLAELDPATAAYREARRMSTGGGDLLLPPRVALAAALAATRSGQRARTTRWLATADRDLDLVAAGGATAARAVAELRARIAVERAFIKLRQGRHHDADVLCREALRQGEAAGADFVVARALHALDLNDLDAGRSGDEERVLRALALFERCGDVSRQAGMWNHLGIRSYYAGDWNAAVDRYERARALHERAGDEWSAVIASANVAEILADQGRVDEAEPLAYAALRVWRTSGTPSDIGFGAALLGRIRALSRRADDAATLYAEAAEAYAANSERFPLVDTRLRVAESLLLAGRAEEAAAELAGAERDLHRAARAAGLDADGPGGLPMRPPHTTTLLRLQGYARGQAGDPVAAAAAFTASRVTAAARESVYDEALALDGLHWLGVLDGSDDDRRVAALRALGVVRTPAFPRTPTAETAEVRLPRQREPEALVGQ